MTFVLPWPLTQWPQNLVPPKSMTPNMWYSQVAWFLSHLCPKTKTLPIQQSKIALKITDPTSFRHPKPHSTMGRSSARNPSSSGKKSTTLAARQPPYEKWRRSGAAPEEGRVGHLAKLPRSGKAKSASPTLPTSTTPIPKGDSVLPPSSSHCMTRRSQRSYGRCLVAIICIPCSASPTEDCNGLEYASLFMTNTLFCNHFFCVTGWNPKLHSDY